MRIDAEDCNKVLTLPQNSGTCWFNAVFMALFYSQGTRRMLLNAAPLWAAFIKAGVLKSAERRFFMIAIEVLQKHFEVKNGVMQMAYDDFSVFSPEVILGLLNRIDPDQFFIKAGGGFGRLYLPQLFRTFNAGGFLSLDLIRNEATKQHELIYSAANGKIDTTKPRKIAHRWKVEYQNDPLHVMQLLNRDNVALAITVDDKAANPKGGKSSWVLDGNFKIQERIFVLGKTYRVDSMLLVNFNTEECKKGHEVAGVTCGGKRFLYNGWMKRTIDPSNRNRVARDLPCQLMEYDWMTEEPSIDFCLNTVHCNIRPLHGNDLNKDVCFHFNKGERTYIYVRDDMYRDENAVTIDSLVDWELDYAKLKKTTRVANAAPSAKKTKEPKATKTKKATPVPPKPCPPGQERNPATGRCKKLDGARAAPTQKKVMALKKTTECPPGKVRNPATGRCKKQ